MNFLIIVDNLFIREGIRSILLDKYPGSELLVLDEFDQLNADLMEENSIIISNQTSEFINNQPKIANLILKKQIKTILLANSLQIEQLLHKDLDAIDALIYTNCSLNDLNEALGRIQAGIKYRCSKFNDVAQPLSKFEQLMNENKISFREFEIIKLVVKGLKSKEIADTLNISYNTVTTHRKNINRKLNLNSPHDLVRLSFGFVDDHENTQSN